MWSENYINKNEYNRLYEIIMLSICNIKLYIFFVLVIKYG